MMVGSARLVHQSQVSFFVNSKRCKRTEGPEPLGGLGACSPIPHLRIVRQKLHCTGNAMRGGNLLLSSTVYFL